MPPLKYLRPKSIEEAREMLDSGVALGGGTTLAPRRNTLDTVVDLQDLGLSDLEVAGGKVVAGAGCSLQQIVEAESTIAQGLAEACRREAAWNQRNMATLAGAVLACDGRSPLATAMLALGARALLAGGEVVDLDDLLDRRPLPPGTLVTALQWKAKSMLRYEQVARSPADRPLVAVAIGQTDGAALRVVLGGFGPRPIRVPRAERALAAEDARRAGEAAAEAFAAAEDVWASAEYRSHVAAVLVRRLAAGGRVAGEGRDKGPGEGRDKGPGEGRDKSPGEGRDKGPGEGRDKGPGEGRDKGPGEGRDRVPSEGRDRVPSEGRDRVPSEAREKP